LIGLQGAQQLDPIVKQKKHRQRENCAASGAGRADGSEQQKSPASICRPG